MSAQICDKCQKELLDTFHLSNDLQMNVCKKCGSLIKTHLPDGAIYCEECAHKLGKCQRCGENMK